MFLLPYLSARLDDINYCETQQIPGHLTFSSGWEWGYWQNDYATLRMGYTLPAHWQDTVDEMFVPWGAPGAALAHGIAALVSAHEKYAGGGTDVLYVDDSLYIMQRTGFEDRAGLIYVLNNRGDNWNGRMVTTKFHNASFQPVAWWSKTDLSRPISQSTDRDGRAQFYAPPRGYAVYAVK